MLALVWGGETFGLRVDLRSQDVMQTRCCGRWFFHIGQVYQATTRSNKKINATVRGWREVWMG